MNVDFLKLGLFGVFLLGFTLVSMTIFDSIFVSMVVLFAFVLCYALVLYFLKRMQGKRLRLVLRQYGCSVSSKQLLDILPYVRGVVLQGDFKVFSRISADSSGVYFYKQGCYSVLLPWENVRISEAAPQTSSTWICPAMTAYC